MKREFGPWLVSLLFAFSAGGASAVTLNVVGGQLLGASGVVVDGNSYNVEFLDGTCIAVYDGCDSNSDFTFQTSASAALAAQALLDQVLVDGAPGAFDTDPELTNGCSDISFCFVNFPYEIAPGAAINVAIAINAAPPLADSVSGVSGAPGSIGVDLSTASSDTWARWTLAASPVPGPGFLLAVGLLIMAVRNLRES